MGYSTSFDGRFVFSRELTSDEEAALENVYNGGHDRDGYCQWRSDGMGLVWDGGEKFYNYVDWLCWLIDEYFEPFGVQLNGHMNYQGEAIDDCGIITVVNNEVEKLDINTLAESYFKLREVWHVNKWLREENDDATKD